MMMYAEVCSWDNLLLAYRLAAKGKRGRYAVAAFEHRLEDNLVALQSDLQKQTYQPGAYQSFYIHEPKRRLISAAPFRDRVAHHALCNVIEPVFESSFIFDSYANRIGKGTHRALNRCQQFSRKYRYALQCDVRQFFPSIDHEILRSALTRKISDSRVIWLADRILQSGAGVLAGEYEMQWFEGDELLAALRPRGLPIGNLTSQFWANCYFNSFDHFVKRGLGCLAYLRYVDDFILFADNKCELHYWLGKIKERLAGLRLTIHDTCSPRPTSEPIPFLGFVVYPDKRRLKRSGGYRFCQRLKKLSANYRARQITLDDLTKSIKGWVNHAHYANTYGLRRSILKAANF